MIMMTFKTFALSFVRVGLVLLFFLMPNGMQGVELKLVDTIRFTKGTHVFPLDRETKAPVYDHPLAPRDFCIIDGTYFVFPEPFSGKVKIAMRDKHGHLRKRATFGTEGLGTEPFKRPTYCFYHPGVKKVGILDYVMRKVLLYDYKGEGRQKKGEGDKHGKKREKNRLLRAGDFEFAKEVPCKMLGYDIDFADTGSPRLVVSGDILNEEEGKPYSLFSINLENNSTDYLLPAWKKYNLEKNDDFGKLYRDEQILPAIGTRAFFDIRNESIFFVWEGALKIIRLNMDTGRIEDEFGEVSSFYIAPQGKTLAGYRKRRQLDEWRKAKKNMSYLKNIFVSSCYEHVYLVYSVPPDTGDEISGLRLQVYDSKDGKFHFLDEFEIPGAGPQMFFDKKTNELYALPKDFQKMSPGVLKFAIN